MTAVFSEHIYTCMPCNSDFELDIVQWLNYASDEPHRKQNFSWTSASTYWLPTEFLVKLHCSSPKMFLRINGLQDLKCNIGIFKKKISVDDVKIMAYSEYWERFYIPKVCLYAFIFCWNHIKSIHFYCVKKYCEPPLICLINGH